MASIKRALISVTDKAGMAEFAKGLEELGVEILSTGGTARLIRESGVAVKDVAEVTGFPEMLDGRVKTIHPRIAGGVLAMRGKPEHMSALAEHDIPAIDMVVVNLYAFEKVAAREDAAVADLIENIDIGGPTMIRAAAKNYQDVAVVTDIADYDSILSELRENGGLSLSTHWELAKKAYALTANYDRAITRRLATISVEDDKFVDKPAEELPQVLGIRSEKRLSLRYGENPHQSAALYSADPCGIAGGEKLHGKELSFNNLVDLDAAWQLCAEFDQAASIIVKHTNPCGCAQGDVLAETYRRAIEADPISAFGGVLAFNRAVDEDTAKEIAKTFIEAVSAPDFSAEALAILTKKKNLRLVRISRPAPTGLAIKSISGGLLAQTEDVKKLVRSEATVATDRQPTEDEWKALQFGWKIVKHVKSNAIVYSVADRLIAAGAGQMSRVDSVKMGALKAVLPLERTVMSSDAFFPFPDGVEEAAKHGITAVIQPGGSVRDAEVVEAANKLGLAMVFTGFRHFRH
jgi:phosphoribosylaminoimidazolecarboxamide formyltransferase / IMP cyclohydrolase